MRVLLATHNAGKLAELRRILAGSDVELVGLADLEPYPEPVESGATFADNALIKARAGLAVAGIPVIADDSGLAVEALHGMPGVLSARWAAATGDGPTRDAANLALLLGQVADVPDERRGAVFHCAAALVAPDGTEHVVESLWRGSLVREARGSNGFGYDPVFVPHGSDRTSAELSPVEKDERSHRGQAMRALAPLVAALRRPDGAASS